MQVVNGFHLPHNFGQYSADLQIMTTSFCTIMFIKIEDSAQLYSLLGDYAARESINHFFSRIRKIIDLLEGKVIKTIDDGLMCRFSSVDEAVKATTLIQAGSGSVEQEGHPGFRVSIGAHQGSVLEEGDDVFGDTVNVAARFKDLARPGQTIISADMVTSLSDDLRQRVRQIDSARLKGKEEEIAVYEVIWELTEEVTRQVPSLMSLGKIGSRLTLTHGDNNYVMTEQQRSILIGRGTNCELIVNTRLASREHAIIEIRRGKFVIKDQGSNGTYVKTANGHEVFLRREEFVLHDEGFISLGEPFAKCTEADLVHFKCS